MKMKIKMIVTDLDGTLLRRDKTISAYTASVFRRCHDAGIKIVFATARPVRAVKRWLAIDIENDACIYHNGAVMEIGNSLFREIGITYEAAGRLLREAARLEGMRIAVEMNDALYANFDASTVWPGVAFSLSDFHDLPQSPADKILFITAVRSGIDAVVKLLDENMYCEVSENQVLMVMHKDARKRNAVSEIAEQYGFTFSDIAAFGDDYNDIEMLRACGAGVAVANAIAEAKAAADAICGGCDEDGVARWLEAHVL